jgi:dihydrofolate synthase/folylpolyglutamate synthase
VVGVLALLAEKDADGVVAALAPVLDRAVCTEVRAERPSRPVAELVAVCDAAGLPAEAEADFGAALARARDLAVEAGGVVLVTGSHYVQGPARAALA